MSFCTFNLFNRRLKAADHQNEVSLGNARDLETLKRDLEKLEAANKALSNQLRETKNSLAETTESRNQFQESSEALDAKCKDLEAKLAAALAEAKTATEQNNATRKRFDAMEATIRVCVPHIAAIVFSTLFSYSIIHIDSVGGNARERCLENLAERQRNRKLSEGTNNRSVTKNGARFTTTVTKRSEQGDGRRDHAQEGARESYRGFCAALCGGAYGERPCERY